MREINISQELAYSKLEVKESALAKSNLFATEKSNEICLSSPQIESHSVGNFTCISLKKKIQIIYHTTFIHP